MYLCMRVVLYFGFSVRVTSHSMPYRWAGQLRQIFVSLLVSRAGGRQLVRDSFSGMGLNEYGAKNICGGFGVVLVGLLTGCSSDGPGGVESRSGEKSTVGGSAPASSSASSTSSLSRSIGPCESLSVRDLGGV